MIVTNDFRTVRKDVGGAGITTNYLKGAVMSYKIWVQIEEIDDSGEHKNNVTEDVEVGEYGSFDEAKKVMDKIIDAA